MLVTIPQELIENILVIAAKDGYPNTVSSLSQTCRHFYHFLSFHSDNRHLWRDLFLAVFDDPHLGALEGKFDWRKEFLNRMQAQRSFKRWTASRANGKNGKGKHNKFIKDTKDAHEQEKRLLQSLQTLLKALLVENPPMAPDLSSSTSSASSASSADSDDFDNMMLFGAPLSDTHLTYPLLIVLHALASQRRARGMPSPYLHTDEKWGMQLLESVKSATSAWAEGVLENGYPNVLKERLHTFDAWMHRRPKSKRRASPNDIVPTIPPFLLSPSTNADIVSDPDWELTETGRLFYKLVMMKGYLFDRPDGSTIRYNGISRRTLSGQKKAARALARRRVYDMKYLTRERLFGPYLPVGRTLEYGLPVPEPEKTQDMMDSPSNIIGSTTPAGDVTNGTTDDSSYYPSSSQSSASSSTSSSDDEGEGELDVFHTDMLNLISAGIHPHYLIHHHLFHHPLSDDEDSDDDAAHGGGGANGLAGGSGGHSQSHQGQSQTSGSPESPNRNDGDGPRSDNGNGTGRVENTKHQPGPIDPLILAETAPHKVVPDYPFLSAARLLIEMNMKDAWSNLISTGHPDGGDNDDDDFDGSGIDDDDGDGDLDGNDDAEEEESEENEENETNRHGAEEDNAIHPNEAPIATHNSSNLSIIPSLPFVSTSSPSALSSSALSLTSHSQLSSFQSLESPATDNTSVNQNISDTGQEDGHDNGNINGNAGANSEEMMASLMAKITRDTRRWVERLVDAFSALDFVRMGSAIGYWRNVGRDVREWRRGNRKGDAEERRAVKDNEEEQLTGKWKGKARAKDGGEECEGWDWAGVEGEWRRVVCWMDYQDLLLHSSGATRINPSFEADEAIRLFPHKLHITGYSPPPAFPSSSFSPLSSPSSLSTSPVNTTLIDECRDETTNPDALIWHLPVIHFAGESRLLESADTGHWNGQPGEYVRQIRGTVRMIGDGAVRWTMTSSHVNQTEPEWAMEGVQVGCIGSAVGVLGLWTGADHIRGDPIGPCWQWKVS